MVSKQGKPQLTVVKTEVTGGKPEPESLSNSTVLNDPQSCDVIGIHASGEKPKIVESHELLVGSCETVLYGLPVKGEEP
jgi:hypothetical protein